MDAKRRIFVKAYHAFIAAFILSAAMYGAEIMAGSQSGSMPSIGIDPAAALLAVTAFSALIVGLVLADRSLIVDTRTSRPADQGENPFHVLASVLVFADMLVASSVFTAFIGLGALVNAVQLAIVGSESPAGSAAKMSTSLQNVLLAFVVAGIAFVFVLLAAANSRSQAEVRAVKTFAEETYNTAAQRRIAWQARWMQVHPSKPGREVLSDLELKLVQKALRPSAFAELWRVIVAYSVIFLGFFIFVFDLRGGMQTVNNPLEFLWVYVASHAIAVGFYTLFGVLAYLSFRQALVSLRNNHVPNAIGWSTGVAFSLLPTTWAAFIALGPFLGGLVLALYGVLLAAVWFLNRKSKVALVDLAGVPLVGVNRKVQLAAFYYAVGAQLRNFSLPEEPEQVAVGAMATRQRLFRTVAALLKPLRKSRLSTQRT
ncbi:hypothetical protein QN357_18775 [Cryobacterium sp. RTC2.1]|uniref:hypothetical protein n=1 Tax=Cryobacterium sp. RTC2.1 TaxID=3048634 RepID=UPI002B2370FC|nr:hypothetical protein [Cryobacterium sp. RTC2.1]MEB0004966.1 hypothetical protein [Cryobacterium sp. RTC2.1]